MSTVVEYFIADSEESAEALVSEGPGGSGWRGVPGPDPSVALTALATLASGISFDDYLEEDDFCGLVAQDGDTVVITVSRAVVDAIAKIKVEKSADLLAKWVAADESLRDSSLEDLGYFVEEFQDLAGDGYANQIYAWIQP
ncbi:hypothetical protein [Tomitella biformata]|uniref:hypothetical protein n=1 Tax=Tomitella biformata TaxID=630403 RepID=UPI0004668C74|nr:hypothetical protein [Tomitella biformata]